MKLIDLEMLRIANQSKEGHPQGVSMGMWRGRASYCAGALCQPVLDLGGSVQPNAGLGENAGTWASMLNIGEPDFQAEGHEVSVNAQEY